MSLALLHRWLVLVGVVFLCCDCDYVAVAIDDLGVVLADMREHAATAVFETVLGVLEITTAILAERVERTVAEKAIEIIRVIRLMTGEEFTILM